MYNKISHIMGSTVVSRFVNIGIAKRISCVVITILLVGNLLTYLDSGMDPCRGILSTGRLLDETKGVWQPHGCMMHNYKTSDAISCLKKKKIAFVGDSRMRALMIAVVHAITPNYQVQKGKNKSDIFFSEDELNIKFYWVPELNETATSLFKSWEEKSDQRPDIIFQAAAPQHTINNMMDFEKAFMKYCVTFTDHLVTMDEMIKNHHTDIFWIPQEPVDESKLAPEENVTNTLLDQYNDALMSIVWKHSPDTKVKMIESFKWVASELIHLSSDGMHLPEQALKIEASILLNYFCNDRLHPVDGTCCQASPSVTAVQILLFLFGVVCLLGAIVLSYLKWKTRRSLLSNTEHRDIITQNGILKSMEELSYDDAESQPQKKPSEGESKIDEMLELISALAKFALIMTYFYVCDRTNIFMKGNKHFTNARFLLPLLYIGLLGLFGVIHTSQTALLNRDQTDEWKGWMQLIILIYHMSGASVNVPIYMHIRVLVAMYIFMTGYGHFSYFWRKGDYSFYRVLNVVFRLNFLTVSLCLVMDRSYQFYYFVPMCTFWFLVLYLTMAMWPQANEKILQTINGTSFESTVNGSENDFPFKNVNLKSPYAIMFFKLCILFLVISLLFVSQAYYEAIFSWWPAVRLFEIPEGSVREWWFRSQLDRYAMLHGAVLCFVYIIMKKFSVLDDAKQGCLFSTKASFITMTAAIGVIILYAVWVTQCTDKVACNRIHSYAAVFLITAFIIVRNVPGYLRSGYSAFFAWFGKISLELFIGQYHIWLAADTKGMLVLISPDWPTLNLVITSFVFVCVAHEINVITGVLTKHLIGPPNGEAMKVLLRFVIFLMSICAISFIQNVFNPAGVGKT